MNMHETMHFNLYVVLWQCYDEYYKAEIVY